jgi:drug/metabolite transporter (DMT)-like permease
MSSPFTLRTHLPPLLILALIVLASAFQTETAHYVTTELAYHQPYFTFFLTHSTFALIFPLHLLSLRLFRPSGPGICDYLSSLHHVVAQQLYPDSLANEHGTRDIARRWIRKVGYLTLLVSVPALCWFVAVTMTSAMDVTAIYATSSFWAYAFEMGLLGRQLSRTTLGAIGLAFSGVMVITLAGQGGAEGDADGGEETLGFGKRMVGDLIMMLGELPFPLLGRARPLLNVISPPTVRSLGR